jgi:ubiquinone/menaquinone biosynthesis C-methylase UbiE
VGCGFGFPSFYLASHGHEVVGVDPSPSQIAVAEKYRRQEGQQSRLSYAVVGESALPFMDNSFDGASFGDSLECVGDAEGIVSEVLRVLKPGSPVAVEAEDRSLEPRTHPVWEFCKIRRRRRGQPMGRDSCLRPVPGPSVPPTAG